jgi:hypothetical protein
LLGGDVQRPSTESQEASSAVTTRVWGRTNRKNRKIKQLKLAAIVKLRRFNAFHKLRLISNSMSLVFF